MSFEVTNPFPVFTDTKGEPLENGKLFIGVVNLNPKTNPVSVFFDEALTIPAAQPIRTIGGYPSSDGTPSDIFIAENSHSITVDDKNDKFIFSNFDVKTETVFSPKFANAITTTVQKRLSDTVHITDYGAIQNDYATDQTSILDTIVGDISLADEVHIFCAEGIKVLPQNIAGLKSSGKSIYVRYFDSGNTGLDRWYQHNQGPFGVNGVPDEGYSFFATDHSAVIIETVTRDTSGTRINQDRPDGNPRPDRVSLLMRKNDFAPLPMNSFQIQDVRQAEDLTVGVEQPELDGTLFVIWHWDTNALQFTTRNAIFLQNFAKGNSQVEANRTGANLTANIGINTYDPKGYQFHIQKLGKNVLISTINSAIPPTLTFLSADSASPDLHYNQLQKDAMNISYSFLSGGTLDRSVLKFVPSGVDGSLGVDLSNGFMITGTNISGTALQSRVICQRYEFGTSHIAANQIETTNPGSPEGAVTAVPGSTCRNTAGGANVTFFVKESGTGNTGWIAK